MFVYSKKRKKAVKHMNKVWFKNPGNLRSNDYSKFLPKSESRPGDNAECGS